MPQKFGPSFPSELKAAGLMGLSFSYASETGEIYLSDESLTDEQRAAIQAVADAHDQLQPAPAVVPSAVTMRQARLALLGAGMLDTVNQAVANMPGAGGQAARIEWEYSQEVQRHKALVLTLAPLLGLSDAQLDQLFITAAGL